MFSGQCLTKLFDLCINPENIVPCCCEPAQFIGTICALLIPHLQFWQILISILNITVVPHADEPWWKAGLSCCPGFVLFCLSNLKLKHHTYALQFPNTVVQVWKLTSHLSLWGLFIPVRTFLNLCISVNISQFLKLSLNWLYRSFKLCHARKRSSTKQQLYSIVLTNMLYRTGTRRSGAGM